jgi:hypothetical protein
MKHQMAEGTIDGIPVTRIEYGPIADLPEPKHATIYIVGADVAHAAAHRPDVFMLANILAPFDDEDLLDSAIYADGLEHA